MHKSSDQQPPSMSRFTRVSSSLVTKLFAVSAISASTCYAFYNFNPQPQDKPLRVIEKNKLNVVATHNQTTIYQNGGVIHGFGYDLARLYANNLNLELNFHVVPDDATALEWVKEGKADFAMTTIPEAENQLPTKYHAFNVACGDIQNLQQYGLDGNLSWVFYRKPDVLTKTANEFVCTHKDQGTLQQLASFYSPYAVKNEAWFFVKRDLKNRLPTYKANFKQSAKEYDLDWHLLAAIGYQESLLKPDSVSPTGVKGLMMLTNNTAKAMGVENREDPLQSIQGGAKYFDHVLDMYQHIPNPDRTWFALVAYNMGPGAVKQIQTALEAEGKNPNEWVNLFDYLQRHQSTNSRYVQAIHYVTRIRSFLEHIKNTETQKPLVT